MLLQGQTAELNTCKFSPSGEHVASAGVEKSICMLYQLSGEYLSSTFQYIVNTGFNPGLADPNAVLLSLFTFLIRSLEHIWRLHKLWGHQRTHRSYLGVALVKRRKVLGENMNFRFGTVLQEELVMSAGIRLVVRLHWTPPLILFLFSAFESRLC